MLGPTAVRQWVDSVCSGERVSQSDFNWLGLAEVSASLSRRGLEPGSIIGKDNIDWALASISAYKWLAEKDNRRAEASAVSSMYLRAYLISRCGARSGDPLLDPQIIVNWFWSDLRMSVEEVADKYAGWLDRINARSGKEADRIDVAEFLELSRIKQRLLVLRFLVETGVFIPDPPLKAWLDGYAARPTKTQETGSAEEKSLEKLCILFG